MLAICPPIILPARPDPCCDPGAPWKFIKHTLIHVNINQICEIQAKTTLYVSENDKVSDET